MVDVVYIFYYYKMEIKRFLHSGFVPRNDIFLLRPLAWAEVQGIIWEALAAADAIARNLIEIEFLQPSLST